MTNAKTELRIDFKSYKTFFGRDAGTLIVRSNGQIYDGTAEIVPCKNCGGPILRFQQRKLEDIVDGKEIFSHRDNKCCDQWMTYLNSHPDIKKQYMELTKIYQAVAGKGNN